MTLTVGQAFDRVFGPEAPVRVIAYDGSEGGSPDGLVLRLTNADALNHILASPGDLGLARAYLSGDLVIEGMDEADPYDVLRVVRDGLTPRRPDRRDAAELARFVAHHRPHPPALPAEETPSPLRRLAHGLRHGRTRDADAISHHYDVSNEFYEHVLGPSMTYTCACFPTDEASLEEAQAYKYDLVARKLGLEPGMRLLDVGCGWGGMVRHAVKHYGVTALGVTLSREQATWAQRAIEADGLGHRAEVRHGDYRDVTERGFDAISSIGLTEHIGVKNYPDYFRFLRERLRDEGRLLNHCITRPDNKHAGLPSRGFINRFVFPDGELTGSGDIVRVIEDEGFEVRHHENLREHYARTCAAWNGNLSKHWDECVELAGLGRARVWGLYLAGSRLAFERNEIQLHQVLASRTSSEGVSGFTLRPRFEPSDG
ncbi:class I SAM-dependent methyltransferase [Terrabacter sp. BE26]|uniref:class I SAM-dependent methyltransferase n=1 Tax=Terrabacter sp. BE26 TaxID=2898152 RepID=UPI0035BE6B66